jgi:hypothetical protein
MSGRAMSERQMLTRGACGLLLAASCCLAQTEVTIRVDAARRIGAFPPIYGWFGYDEPNYTYTQNGRKLIGELAGLSPTPVYIRTHFLLATGNGEPGLKWGSRDNSASGPIICLSIYIFRREIPQSVKHFAHDPPRPLSPKR